jgi:hypothetical protein
VDPDVVPAGFEREAERVLGGGVLARAQKFDRFLVIELGFLNFRRMDELEYPTGDFSQS